MNVTTPPENSAPSPRQLLKTLQEQYAVFRECRALSIGIDKQIIAAQPDVPRKVLRIALGIHTNSTPYLKAMERATSRFDLQGNAAGEVVEEHRERAKTMLRERYKKVAEQRKAQREAEEAERRHAEKLEQLTAKFSKK
ncbi:ProQ/FINO family protein [Noviherbaspirillum saxi]|uniref:Osmoprotectant transporter activator n=1 Tax=Noviherbaspirillum saxi TaxID=2320863 RepID=A0A3A3FL60_9BURK|nr:ProQ/FINO family protein [Noviherbaspirillum saxi]RJF96037.1 osmoprotectant transporter activator [Noviherbaspirillum saxi]